MSGNTPVTDIVRPVKIRLFHALGNQSDLTILYGFHGRLNQFFHLYKPLLFYERLNRGFAAVMGSYIMGIVLDPNQKAHFFQFGHNLFSGCVAVHALELAAVFIDGSIVVHNIDHRKIMALAYFKVVRVVSRRNFNYARTELTVYIAVCHNGNPAVYKGQPNLAADQVLIPLVIGMYGYRRIAQHRLRPGGCKLQKFCLADFSVFFDDRIFDMPEMSGLFLVFNLRIGNGGVTYGTPVDNTGAFIDPAFLMHFAEHFGNGLIASFIHGKAFSLPVAGGTKLF